ncbi:MAG: LysR family transcriptional regulator [Pseudomonadota bacterium]
MLEGIDALIALEKFGTVSEAAIRLRLTQSAISKRIQALQRIIGFQLVEPDGRRIRLTAPAIEFLERARPLVADLRGLTGSVQEGAASDFSIALADSIASSWGPGVIKRALHGLRGVSVRLHAHRSVLLIESVRLGRYHIGLSTDLPAAKDLIHYPVIDEPLVLVNSGLGTKAVRNQPLISIEPSSATWSAIEPQIRAHHPQLLARSLVPVETFSATVQMVKAGFGDGLVPLGLALEMDLDRRCYREIRGVSRHISLVTRKTVSQLANFRLLRERLVQESAAYFSSAGAGT